MQGMEEFEGGQLVAVRDRNDDAWKLRVVVDRPRPEDDDPLIACWAVEAGSPRARPWTQAKPAEDVWPELFLWRTSEDMNRMRRLRQSLGVMRRQVERLCTVLAKRTHTILDCPPGIEPGDACDCGGPDCAECWRKASLDAVMEGRDGSED